MTGHGHPLAAPYRYENVGRPHATKRAAAGAAPIHDRALATQLEWPEELVAWKYPETFTPVDALVLTPMLQSASENDRDTGAAVIARHAFADITALSSIASYRRQAGDPLRRFDARQSHPQQSLF